jgi:hypothetical protein
LKTITNYAYDIKNLTYVNLADLGAWPKEVFGAQ